ncbi:MAG: MarR family winged helix-turn-helix transcriptional regulator [Hyphomonadaceae bacterium]
MADQYAAQKASSEQPAMDPRPSALSHEACILRHVSRVSRAVVAAYDPALAPLGLTGHQFNLMMTLGNMGPMTVGALADTLGMDASGVPRAVRPLADDGMISIERGADRRQRVLSLTVLGRTRLERATPAWSRVQEELVNTVGAPRWQSLMSELRAVQKAAADCSTRKPAPADKKS